MSRGREKWASAQGRANVSGSREMVACFPCDFLSLEMPINYNDRILPLIDVIANSRLLGKNSSVL